MKKLLVMVAAMTAMLTGFADSYDLRFPAEISYFPNYNTGRAAVYFAFELRPGREYSLQISKNGEDWVEVSHISTKGRTEPVYRAWWVIDPCVDAWPRMIDLGVSQ